MKRDPANLDSKFMRAAIRLARSRSLKGDGGPFGAVVVQGDRIVGRGWNRVISRNDPTAHAEVVAIRSASRKLESFSLRGCVLYTSCEPCPMCLSAAYWARLDEVVHAADRTDAATIGFDDVQLYRELVLPSTARSLPFRQHLREEAVKVMQVWKALPDRVIY